MTIRRYCFVPFTNIYRVSRARKGGPFSFVFNDPTSPISHAFPSFFPHDDPRKRLYRNAMSWEPNLHEISAARRLVGVEELRDYFYRRVPVSLSRCAGSVSDCK